MTRTDIPKLFRITVEVANLDQAAAFYAKLFDTSGKRHPGARHYFDCGGVIVAVIDPSQGGLIRPLLGLARVQALAPASGSFGLPAATDGSAACFRFHSPAPT